jgi:diguanylate cyclase (GGDEF)-like protein
VLATALSQANRSGDGCAVLMLDIDHFKRLNDSFGHPAGDEVLRSVAQRLQSELRAGSSLGRWGGEEFIVIAPQTDLRGAQQLGERLRHAVSSEPTLEEHPITISVGIGVYRPGDSPETLVSRADQALYRAKQGGRNRTEA